MIKSERNTTTGIELVYYDMPVKPVSRYAMVDSPKSVLRRKYIKYRAHSVSVITLGNEPANPSSNPGKGCLHFTLRKYPLEMCTLNYSLYLHG